MPNLKLAIMVDSDVDVFNESEVMWAATTQARWDKDVTVIPRVQSFRGWLGDAVCIIDATHHEEVADYPERNRIPEDSLKRLRATRILDKGDHMSDKGGDYMKVQAQSVATSKEAYLSPDVKRFLYVMISVALGLVTYLLPVAMAETGRRALAISIFVIAMFILEPVPLAVSGLLGCWLYWVWARVPVALAFSGFHNDTPWFILCVLLLGIMAESSGLAKRIAYNMVCRLSTSYSSILAGMMVLNFLLTFLIPSGLAKAMILCTISIGLIQSYGLAKNSNIGRGLMLAMTYQCGLFDKVILAGAATILSRGMIERFGHVQTSYGLWLVAYLPITILTLIACWWLTLKLFPPEKKVLEGGKEFCRAELDRMGPISAREIRACVIVGIATLLWATDQLHGISASKIGVGAGLVACLPWVGGLKRDDFGKANLPIVVFIGAAMCLGNVMASTEILKTLTAVLFKWMTPILSSASIMAGVLLYWYANLFHLFLANEPSMISATMPSLMQFAIKQGFNPLTLGMLWGFAAGGKVFVYQSAVMAVGYAFGYFTAKDLFKFGLAIFFVESFLLLVIVPWYWPLLGLTFR